MGPSSYHIRALKGQGSNFQFWCIILPGGDSIRLEIFSYPSPPLNPWNSEKISRFPFATCFFCHRFTFNFSMSLYFLRALQWLVQLVHVVKISESNLASGGIFYFQGTWKNFAYWFLENIFVPHLPSQTPYLESFLYSVTSFPYAAMNLCVFCQSFHTVFQIFWSELVFVK